MTLKIKLLLFVLIAFSFSQILANDFTLVNKDVKVSIVYDAKGPRLDSISAYLLAKDVEQVTGYRPVVVTEISKARGNVIVIGNIQSALLQKLVGRKSEFYKSLVGKWECYGFKVLTKPAKNISKALIIAGSDTRGTAYGVFTLSEKIGVSPWYWWADVPVKHKKELSVNQPDFVSAPPSIQHRGIFINDEDWGLQPWAAKTFEPETGDIGPKTYAKVFELLLRLKANLIWPAMHPSTRPFYHYPDNKKVADDYCIIVGTSHAEPMLRNNVGEWNSKTMGAFNYITNRDIVYKYWEERVKETRGNDVIYTLGMRGVHDSGMEGVKDPKEAVALLQKIIAEQRDLLAKYNSKKITDIPQVFTAYKEVLDIYDKNLKLPDDVTLVWPDDNYGYIQRLNNDDEKNRSGGSGVYYHASYWGRPHDYLWLSSTHPSLIREEMIKAYRTGCTKLWVLNVGDIKPLEYNIQMFMDMAFRTEPFSESSYTRTHLQNWIEKIFESENTRVITDLLWTYYQLAFERRPEFMGWSQTEPTTQTRNTDYNHFYFGDEAQLRIDRYTSLQKHVQALQKEINQTHTDVFYQLVYYPVMGAALINKKFLYNDKAILYGKQNRSIALDYTSMTKQVYDSIVAETEYYNNRLANGKWKHIMSMEPRDLPVFHPLNVPQINIDKSLSWSIAPEGYANLQTTTQNKSFELPEFSKHGAERYFIDIFLCSDEEIRWNATTTANWIKLSQTQGVLKPELGKKQVRLWVSVDWQKINSTNNTSSEIIFSGEKEQIVVNVFASAKPIQEQKEVSAFVEQNGIVSMYASHFSRNSVKEHLNWTIVNDLGHTGDALMAMPLLTSHDNTMNDSTLLLKSASFVAYDFVTFKDAAPDIYIFTLPTHPVNNRFSMRYGVSIDNGPVKILDFKTYGRSEEWKQNVLRNSAIKTFQPGHLSSGKHTLRIYAIDPGVILDRIVINLGNKHKAYSVIPETK